MQGVRGTHHRAVKRSTYNFWLPKNISCPLGIGFRTQGIGYQNLLHKTAQINAHIRPSTPMNSQLQIENNTGIYWKIPMYNWTHACQTYIVQRNCKENIYMESSSYLTVALILSLSVLVERPGLGFLRPVLVSARQGLSPGWRGSPPTVGVNRAGEAKLSCCLTHRGITVCLRQST